MSDGREMKPGQEWMPVDAIATSDGFGRLIVAWTGDAVRIDDTSRVEQLRLILTAEEAHWLGTKLRLAARKAKGSD